MTVQDWIHRFPLLKDQFAIFEDWPLDTADTWNNATWQDVFTALGLMQDYAINYFRDYIPCVSIDGFDKILDVDCSVTPYVSRVRYIAWNTNEFKAYLKSEMTWYQLVATGKKVIAEWILFNLEVITDQIIMLHLTNSYDIPPSDTEDHFGFKIVNSDLYASNADGDVQKVTDTGVNLSAGDQFTRLKVILNPGTDCKFYVNGILKVTHTQNLPRPESYRLVMGIQTQANAAKSMSLGRVLIEKEY